MKAKEAAAAANKSYTRGSREEKGNGGISNKPKKKKKTVTEKVQYTCKFSIAFEFDNDDDLICCKRVLFFVFFCVMTPQSWLCGIVPQA